jgi:hypothetical protein
MILFETIRLIKLYLPIILYFLAEAMPIAVVFFFIGRISAKKWYYLFADREAVREIDILRKENMELKKIVKQQEKTLNMDRDVIGSYRGKIEEIKMIVISGNGNDQ